MEKYLKWTATGVLIVGQAVVGLGLYPIGPLILLVGGLLWLAVSIMWQEPALIVTNSVMTLTAAGALLYRYLTIGF